jgi:hypothetical protein
MIPIITLKMAASSNISGARSLSEAAVSVGSDSERSAGSDKAVLNSGDTEFVS